MHVLARCQLSLKFVQLLCELDTATHQLSQFNKRANDVDAHHHRALAIKNVGRHHCAVFGKSVGQKAWIAMLLGTGRNLRPVAF